MTYLLRIPLLLLLGATLACGGSSSGRADGGELADGSSSRDSSRQDGSLVHDGGRASDGKVARGDSEPRKDALTTGDGTTADTAPPVADGGCTLDYDASSQVVTPEQFGAKGDGVIVDDAVIAADASTFTSASLLPFDGGAKPVAIWGAGKIQEFKVVAPTSTISATSPPASVWVTLSYPITLHDRLVFVDGQQNAWSATSEGTYNAAGIGGPFDVAVSWGTPPSGWDDSSNATYTGYDTNIAPRPLSAHLTSVTVVPNGPNIGHLDTPATYSATNARAVWGTDDTKAVGSAIQNVLGSGGGTVSFAAKTYVVNGLETARQACPYIALTGAGVADGGTTLIATSLDVYAVMLLHVPSEVDDMTIDANLVASNGVGANTNYVATDAGPAKGSVSMNAGSNVVTIGAARGRLPIVGDTMTVAQSGPTIGMQTENWKGRVVGIQDNGNQVTLDALDGGLLNAASDVVPSDGGTNASWGSITPIEQFALHDVTAKNAPIGYYSQGGGGGSAIVVWDFTGGWPFSIQHLILDSVTAGPHYSTMQEAINLVGISVIDSTHLTLDMSLTGSNGRVLNFFAFDTLTADETTVLLGPSRPATDTLVLDNFAGPPNTATITDFVVHDPFGVGQKLILQTPTINATDWNIPGALAGPVTALASASNGLALGTGPFTLNVVSTVSPLPFEVPGDLTIISSQGLETVSCTGSDPTSFTGCSGGSGTLATGALVAQMAATNVDGGSPYLQMNVTARMQKATFTRCALMSGLDLTHLPMGALTFSSSVVGATVGGTDLSAPASIVTNQTGDTGVIDASYTWFAPGSTNSILAATSSGTDWQVDFSNCAATYSGALNSGGTVSGTTGGL
jgi:hypothetical protein